MLPALIVALTLMPLPQAGTEGGAVAGAWIEGEAAAKKPSAFQVGGWGRRRDLSGESWLHVNLDADAAAKLKADETTVAFDIRIEAEPGRAKVKRILWARIGFEFARSPFRWRIGETPWQTVTPEQLTIDLMAIEDFAEVAWLNLGEVELAPGGYSMEFQPLVLPKQRLLFALDCVYLARGEFRPNGPHRPGKLWKYALDYEAEKAQFRFPSVPKETPPQTRRTLDLDGVWQIARFDEQEVVDRIKPIADLPSNPEALFWRGIAVPGDRNAELPEWSYSHRTLYRTRVEVPKELAGRSFVLRFPNNALMTTVWVDGLQVGFSKTPCAAFECDATGAVKPGQVNEIVVGIKDLHYAVAKTADGRSPRYLFNLPPAKFHEAGGLGATKFADFPTLFKVRRHGILETPTLTAGGIVYADDVFTMSSVTNKTITLRTSVTNPTAEPVEVELQHHIRGMEEDGTPSGEPKKLPTTRHSVPAGKSIDVEATEPWATPRLWWPDDPFRYVVITTVFRNGKPIDERMTPFGFREWGITGRDFTLNGVPWHFRADLRGNDPTSTERLPAVFAEWRKHGQNMMRYWGEEPWTGRSQRETLTALDRGGMAVRRSGIFDGEVASYQLVIDGKINEPLFEHWRDQLAAWIKAERNHPSIFVWSLENEITYINARNFGWLKQVELEIKKAAALVRQLDPTRPVMIDGGDALLDQSLPVAGNHYLEQDHRDYPNEAYTLAKGYARHTLPRPWDPWPIPTDKPLFLGESFYANGSPPAAYADLIGDAAFLGRREASRGVAKFARMLSEGYRTHGVAAFHFWFAEGPDAEHYKAWQPIAVFTREWNSAWPAGTKFNRTLTLLNDTRVGTPLTVHWLLQTRNSPTVTTLRGKQEHKVAPGGKVSFTVELDLPSVPADSTIEADWVVTATREGKEITRDVKPVRLLGPPLPIDGPTADTAAIFDPAGKLPPALRKLVVAGNIASPAEVPASIRLLLVGPDALTAEEAMKPTLANLAARGVRVIVFDQRFPLHFQGAPVDLEPTLLAGRIAFPDDAAHPAFAGLTSDDFFCWSGDHVCYRNAYRKPGRGARSLLACDVELGLTALLELPVGEGLMLLNQTPLGAKPDDPVALRLAANLIRHAWTYRREVKSTAVALPTKDPRSELLQRTGLKFDLADDPIAAMATADIVIVDGTKAVLESLSAAVDKRKAFRDRGGKLVVCNLTAEALPTFNKLVEWNHVLRPFRRERVLPAAARSPLAAGLSVRDVALVGTEKIYPWAGDRYPADDTFTSIVDLDDAAPFAASDRYDFGWKQMTDGLTSADSWKFVFYHDQSQAGEFPSWSARLAKPEIPKSLELVVNTDYRIIAKLRVVFDGDRTRSLVVTLKPERDLVQVFPLAMTRPIRTIALEPLEWTAGSKPIVGIDELRLRVQRSADVSAKVVPFFNVGGLVDYPQAGILLNQIRVDVAEANPVNRDRKASLLARVLAGFGADLSEGRGNATNIAYKPVPLGDQCNAYLAVGKTRPAGVPDLAFIPVGEQRFAEVPFEIRDFKTSPLPAAVMLGPKATPVEIPVGSQADLLFFLHTFHTDRIADAVAWEYVVSFTDGESVVVPIVPGRQVGALVRVGDAVDLPLPAWVGKFPDGNNTATLYAYRWTSPRPGVAIRSVTMRRPAGKEAAGTPIWLGLTIGSTGKPLK